MTSEWQPIETAPRDGEPVLLFSEVWGMTWGEIQIGYFDDGEWVIGERSVADNDPDYDPNAEVDEDDIAYDISADEPNLGPTHWMPLPAAPDRIPS